MALRDGHERLAHLCSLVTDAVVLLVLLGDHHRCQAESSGLRVTVAGVRWHPAQAISVPANPVVGQVLSFAGLFNS
jgi:hypothetical protein